MASPASFGLPSTNWPRPRVGSAGPPIGLAEAASFEAHPESQFLVDRSGQILRANAAGRQVLGSGNGAAEFAARLASGTGPRVRALREQIAEAIRTQVASPELEIAFSPAPSMTFRAIPLGAVFDCALVLVRPSASRGVDSPSERFGFTNAESLVATRLAKGLPISEIAAQLGISVETVRCHLKQAFVKAGVHRQAELVGVMLRG
jgi:DNA-binding CsgD family transcriptional regulator